MKWTGIGPSPLFTVALGVLLALTWVLLGAGSTAVAQGDVPAVTHIVQAGETLTRIANRYGVTVFELVAWNGIQNPDLIFVDQVLAVKVPGRGQPPAAQPSGGPLAFTWSLVHWRADDPDYIATLTIQPQGGHPPYTFYHDGLPQQGDTFEIAWRRCRPKPGSLGVADAAGTTVKKDYWLLAPYCPVGVEILEPAEGAHLQHYPRHFNVTWQGTVDPPPALYGLEIEVWQEGTWRPWQTYTGFAGDLFFVPDEFPGDLGGRVRMWGIYEGRFAGPKTPWRTFEFRITY